MDRIDLWQIRRASKTSLVQSNIPVTIKLNRKKGEYIMDEPIKLDEKEEIKYINEGISLRDYFAGQASEKDIEYYSSAIRWNDTTITREQARYRYADAMLKAREEV
jgi:hypothetical protein